MQMILQEDSPFYDLMIESDPNNPETIYAGGIDLFKSTTGG